MFCPFCRDVFIMKDGHLYCERGDMYLSQNMEQRLTSRCGEGVQSNAGQPSFLPCYKTGGRWFCPGCGVLLDEQMSCPSCGQSLKDCHYHLLELHPHLPYSHD